MSRTKPSRRGFLQTSAAAGAAALTLPAASYARVRGANDQINVGFLGVGGRCQQHIDVVLQMQKEGKPIVPFAVCDVWDGQAVDKLIKGRGLHPSADKCGIPKDDKKRCTKDYREVINNPDVDIVCVATPDHWHARMAIDALKAKKDVYCEKPMTRTIPEAQAVVDAWKESGRVMIVGVQSMADPTWAEAHKYIAAGNIGHVLQGQTSYFRNSSVGQWRYYPLTTAMSPKTIDWKMWLGSGFEVNGVEIGPKELAFDRAVWGQWRCYWPFGGGMFTDLFVHQTTHLIRAMGLEYPRRVIGAGGIYMEYDNRDVPDTAMVVADYDEGCQFIVGATMCNDTQFGEMIRGHLATLKFVGGGDYIQGFEVYGQNIAGGPAKPKAAAGVEPPVFKWENPKLQGLKEGEKPNATYDLWAHFVECVRAQNRNTWCTPELGAAAFTTVNMGVQSYRFGKALFWDKEQRKTTEADASWASAWEKRSKDRGKPNQIKGWTGGDKGSLLEPPAYQALQGPWVDGKDPAPADYKGA